MRSCMSLSVGYSLILAMWGKNSQPAIQIFGLGWSVGGIFGPLIAVPFVSTSSEEDADNRTCVDDAQTNGESWLRQYSMQFNEDGSNSRSDRYPDDSSIEVAFWIVSCCIVSVAAMFVAMFVCFKPQSIGERKKYDWSEIRSPSKWAFGDKSLGIKVILLYIIAFVFYSGLYNGPGTFLATYAYDSELCFDKQEAALLSSAFNLAGSAGRVVVIVISKWVDVIPMFAVLTHGSLISGILLAFVGTTSQTALWVTACIFPLFYRPIWGSIYVWTNNYIILLASMIALQALINAFFSFFIVSMQGYLYVQAEETIFYTTIFYGALLCIVYYFMLALSYNRPTRHEREKQGAPTVFVVPTTKLDAFDDVTNSSVNSDDLSSSTPSTHESEEDMHTQL